MTREEFAVRWMDGNRFICNGEWVWTQGVMKELLGSLYDLQQQISELQEKVDEHNKTKDY